MMTSGANQPFLFENIHTRHEVAAWSALGELLFGAAVICGRPTGWQVKGQMDYCALT